MKNPSNTSGPTTPRAVFIKRLALAVLLVDIFVVLLAGWSLNKNRLQYEESAAVEGLNLARFLEQYIESSFDKVDLVLLAAIEEREKQVAAGEIDRTMLKGFLERQSSRLPELVYLRILDEKGDILCVTGPHKSSVKNAGDREYFVRVKNEPGKGLVISSPLVSRITGKCVIVLARRITRPDGSFAGMVTGAVPIEYFIKFFSSINVGRHGAICLRDDKLDVIAGYPEPGGMGSIIGKRTVCQEFRKMLANGKNSGTFNAISPLDKLERKATFRKFSRYPLYINVCLAPEDYLAKWRVEVSEILAAVIIFLLVSLFISRQHYIYWKQRNDDYLTLMRQEEKFRTVADYTDNWEFWMGPDGEFIYTSPSCEKVTGYDAKAFYSDTGLKERIIHPDDRRLFDGHYHGPDLGNGTKSLIFRINHADGSTRWIEHICRPILDANGVYQGTRGSNRDITGRKETEEELIRSEERYRRIVDTANEGIWVIGPNTETILVNTRMAEMLGYSRTEMIGRPYTDFMFEEDLADHLKQMDNRRRGISETYERRFHRKDGQTVWTHASATPLFDAEQLFNGSFGMFTDITERKKAEGRLAELNECFLRFGADSDKNIDLLVALCGAQIGAACAVYSRLEGEELRPISTWNTPDDFCKKPHSPGQICHDVFYGFKDQVIVIEDLQQSGYMETDPKVSRYGINTYTGRTVSFSGSDMGLLCAVFIDDRTPGEEEKKLLGIIAAAIGVEEERKRALAALKESEATLRSITGSARDAIIMIDSEGRTSFWNKTATQIFGWNEAQALGNDLHSMILPDRYKGSFSKGIKRFATTGTGSAIGKTIELQALRKDGSEVPVEVSLSAVQIKGQWNAVGIIRDITERKRAEAEIEHIAYHDALTGLPNRLLLDDRLSQAIAHASRSGHMTGVLFFDLDNFKSVNDSLGHPVGDMLLRMVVERLGDRLRKSDSIARMGGDEFIIVLMEISAPEDAAHAARFFLEAFSDPFQLVGQEIYTSASVGISIYPIDGTSTTNLIKNADIAMYQAKKLGRNSFQFFTKDINRRAEERLILENDLRHAVNKGEFILHYQPWVDLASGSIGGMEALVRWVHPQQGIIPPNRFIPIAEDTGLIIPIGEWVIKSACRFLEELYQKGLKGLKMSVNVSGKQMRSPNLIGLLGLLLADAVFEPSHLELELTESSVMDNLDESRKYMDAFKMLGVSLALDDFGTGYSSLSYLKRFPLDRLKIDRSFVKDCPDNPDDVAIARAVIALARTLNLQVTAEGVENMAQADFFSREKCDVIQGNLISVPIPGKELMQLLCG